MRFNISNVFVNYVLVTLQVYVYFSTLNVIIFTGKRTHGHQLCLFCYIFWEHLSSLMSVYVLMADSSWILSERKTFEHLKG